MTITRLWQAGAEHGHLYEWDTINGLLLGTTPKTGTYSFRTYGNGDYGRKLFTATRQVRVGWWWKHGFYNTCWRLQLRDALDNVLVGIYQDSYDFDLYVDGVQEDTEMLWYDTWQHWCIDVKIDSSSGWAKVYHNGIEALSFTGDTGNADLVELHKGRISGNTATVSGYFDDIYIDDTTGEGSAAPGPMLRLYPLTLDGNGNYAQWDGSDGNSTDNYQLVDEVPASTSDYVETNVADEYDSYTMTGITLEAGQTINAVIPSVYAKKAGATEEIAVGTRLSTTDLIGSDQTPMGGYGAGAHIWERQTTKPGGGSWSESDVNGAELVIKSRGSY